MGKETLYRFELSFAGEEQGVGILQGLGDTPIPFAVRDDFFRVFDSLPVPKNISTPDDSQIVFWFTEKGLQQYADVINGIIQELEEVDWQVVAMPLVIDSDASNGLSLKNALYKDEFQVAFSRSDILEFTSFNFKEIACIDINLEDPLVCSYRADEAEYIVCGDDTFEIIDYIPNGYEFWNIGAAMAEGYLPLCRPSQFQPYPGANRIDAENLKAIRLDGAQTVLAASIHGQTTVAAMEEYLERYRGKSTDPSVLEQVKRIEAALEVLKDVKCFSAASKSNENHDQVPTCRFNLGDLVKIPYISDCYRHNDEVGEVTWIHPYKAYPDGDINNYIWKYQMEITYPDGQSIIIDPDRKPSGLVSEVILVEAKTQRPTLDSVIQSATHRADASHSNSAARENVSEHSPDI